MAAPDLKAATDAALSEAVSVALVEQPYRVAGRRSPAAASRLDAAWTAVIDHLLSGELRGLPLIVGGRSLGARVACRTVEATGAVAVLCLAFPLQPPARSGSAATPSRLGELDAVTVPMLVVQGESDRFGMPPAGPESHRRARTGRSRPEGGPRGGGRGRGLLASRRDHAVTSEERTAAVVGAGIGGLATGIALRRAGWEVTVFEQAEELRPLGAGLSIWPNGVHALRSLGLGALADEGPRGGGALRRADGSVLAEFDPDLIAERYGAPLVGVHRPDLHEALIDGVGPERVRLGSRLTELARKRAALRRRHE